MTRGQFNLWKGAYFLVLLAAVPVAALYFAHGVYHLGFIAAAAVVLGVMMETTGWNPFYAARPAPSLVYDLELPRPLAPAIRPVTITVTEAFGTCPLGFQPGASWSVDQTGHLSQPLCRPAVAALSKPLIATLFSDEEGGEARCQCPLGEQSLVFAASRN